MTSREQCPRPEELTRILASGADEALLAHIEHCAVCAAEAKSFYQMKEIGKQLVKACPDPSQDRVDDVLHSLLNEVPMEKTGPGRTRYWTGIAIAASVALVVGAIAVSKLLPMAQNPKDVGSKANRGIVYAHGGAQYVTVDGQPDEIIRLTEGTITVEVDKLHVGERFRVVIGDAEVEVHGTAFDVTAKDDRLVAVRVIRGEVEVRPMEALSVILKPGEKWPKSKIATLNNEDPRHEEESNEAVRDTEKESAAYSPIDSEREESVSGRHEAASSAKEKQASPVVETAPPQREASAAEKAFQNGWTALRGGRPKVAAKYFAQSVVEGDNDPIAEDASFWVAVANDRAGLRTRAIADLRQFIQRYPASTRVGEASVMLGWKLVEQEKHDAARNLFEGCLKDPAPSVRASARQGLADLDSKKQSTAGIE